MFGLLQSHGGREAEAYKESEGGRAWAGAKASEKLRNGEAGVCSAEAYAGAAALKDGNHEGLKVCIG